MPSPAAEAPVVVLLRSGLRGSSIEGDEPISGEISSRGDCECSLSAMVVCSWWWYSDGCWGP